MIRPLQPGDLYLIQRLNRQATRFLTVQTFLQPYSVTRSALESAIPLGDRRATTYVLRQDRHGLVHDGFLQAQRRAGWPEADIVCLAPSLDAPTGHPATWTKLLSAYLHDAMEQGVERIYVDVLDQPMFVNTFCTVGFQTYSRQTIWRLFAPALESLASQGSATIRPATPADDWAVSQLYLQTTPELVQQAEGAMPGQECRSPILSSWLAQHGMTYLLINRGEVCGAMQIATGRHGAWMQWWADALQTDMHDVRQLVSHGLMVMLENHWRTPIYMAVADYQSGANRLLMDFGFAPFSDRVKLVKTVVKRVRETVGAPATTIEVASEVVPTSFAPPEWQYRGRETRPSTTKTGNAL